MRAAHHDELLTGLRWQELQREIRREQILALTRRDSTSVFPLPFCWSGRWAAVIGRATRGWIRRNGSSDAVFPIPDGR